MENPATWSEAEKTIGDAVGAHEQAMRNGIVGPSLVRRIHDALNAKGLLVVKTQTTVPVQAQEQTPYDNNCC